MAPRPIMKFGEYLVYKGELSKDQLKEALAMQVDNPNLLLGEIFVSMDFLTSGKLMSNIESYVNETGAEMHEFHHWLTQSEIDQLVARLKSSR